MQLILFISHPFFFFSSSVLGTVQTWWTRHCTFQKICCEPWNKQDAQSKSKPIIFLFFQKSRSIIIDIICHWPIYRPCIYLHCKVIEKIPIFISLMRARNSQGPVWLWCCKIILWDYHIFNCNHLNIFDLVQL